VKLALKSIISHPCSKLNTKEILKMIQTGENIGSTFKPTGKKRLLGYRLRRILKSVGRDVKHCEFCTTTKNLTIHHKDGNPTNNQPENLQVLCDYCHKNVHSLERSKEEEEKPTT
jgi:5-methylcytosine-specific restriction endonuclease McrA